MRLGRLFAILMCLCAMNAHAVLNQRSFVSAATGSDLNNCTRPAPCRNFAAAIAQTQPNGEVIVLDSGGYGVVTITQGVALEADGVVASIAVFSGNSGVTVNAAGGDRVVLRGLTINGLGGNDGVQFNSGLSLTVDNGYMMRLNGFGVNALSPGSSTHVKDSTFLANLGGGVRVYSAGAVSKGVVEHVRVQGAGSGQTFDAGVMVGVSSHVTVRDSVLSDCYYGAIASDNTNDTEALGMLENSLLSGNFYGATGATLIILGAPSIERSGVATSAVGGPPIAMLRASNCTFVHNLYGVSGNVVSRSNNTLIDNTFSSSFAGTYMPQ